MRARRSSSSTTARRSILAVSVGYGYVATSANRSGTWTISVAIAENTPAEEATNKSLTSTGHKVSGADEKARNTLRTIANFSANVNFAKSRRRRRLNWGIIRVNRRLSRPFIHKAEYNHIGLIIGNFRRGGII